MKNKFKCPYCKNTYETKSGLAQHIKKKHTNIKKEIPKEIPKKEPSDKILNELKEYFNGRALHNITVNANQKTLFKYAMKKLFKTEINIECAIHIRQAYIRLFKHFNNLEPDPTINKNKLNN